MKATHFWSFAAALSLTSSANAAVLAFWDFNDGFAVANETVQIVHNASSGSGTLYQQRADTDGNGKGGVAFVDAANGINASDGRSMAWDDVGKSGDNDAEFFIVFSTAGFQDIQIRFDLQGNADGGIASYDLKYDTNNVQDTMVDLGMGNVTIKDFQGGISNDFLNNTAVNNPLTFSEITVDLSSVTAINDQSVVVLRFDDWKENDALRIDNFLITGTATPEPSSVALLGLGSCALVLRRRRK